MVICLNTQMYICLLRGEQEFSAQVRRGGKNVVRDYQWGARFECERFSEFHRTPPAVNNDHSLKVVTDYKSHARWVPRNLFHF